MEARKDICYQFFQELIENYRHQILQKEEAKELTQKEAALWEEVDIKFNGPYSEEYKLVVELTGCILDISSVKQEQLYIQGVRDGIRIRNRIKEIEEG